MHLLIVVLMAALKVAKSELRKSLKRAIMGLNEVDRHQQSISLCQKVRGAILYSILFVRLVDCDQRLPV